METPPTTLGLTLEQVTDAQEFRKQVRYWPLKDMPCQPHTGWIRSHAWYGGKVDQVQTDDWDLILWVTGKSGFVCASHCELV